MEHMKSAVPTIIMKKRGKVMEEMEKLLSVWMQDQHQRRVLLSLMLIQEKAKSLYEDLKKKHGEESEGASVRVQIWYLPGNFLKHFEKY